MTADIDRIVDRFGPPVAVVAGQHHEITDAKLRQHVSDQTHIHARTKALLRLHLDYPKHVTVSTLHDTGPEGDFDLTWRVLAVLGDYFTHAGFQQLQDSSLVIGAREHPAVKGQITNDVHLDLAGIVAYIPDQARSVVVIAPPEQLDGIRLDWTAAK